MTIKIEREKAAQKVHDAWVANGINRTPEAINAILDQYATLGLVEFVEPKSAEDAAYDALDSVFVRTNVQLAIDAMKRAGIGFTFTGESKCTR